MENKINIAQLLKGCPKGMELDCVMFENVTFEGIKHDEYPIIVKIKEPPMALSLTKTGGWNLYNSAKCVIFPKGKTTWEGFEPPYKFKDGDVVATTEGLWIGITTGGKIGKFIPVYCVIQYGGKFEAYLDRKESWVFNRLATEEEKAKLFDAIKENGYEWNPYTKTLEKLVKPKFKVGDVIQDIDGYKVRITDVSIEDGCYGYESLAVNGIGGISFNRQDDWELVPSKFDINTLKPFDKVLVRSHNSDV